MYNIQGMASLAFSALFICTFMATVCGQAPVVSTSTITTGQTFSIYCDSTRVAATSVAASISSLTLNRTVTGGNNARVAQYFSLRPPGLPTEIPNPPAGRQWNFTFTGANGGNSNKDTMKIMVDVNDAQCSDAGVYYCQIEYFPTSNGASKPALSPGQNVTASMGLSEFGLTADPVQEIYQVDDNVTFTCTAKGPSTGVTFMWEFWTEDQNGELFKQNALPVTNPATLQPGNTGCQLYSYVSTLSIQLPPNYDSQTYKCIVSYQQQQQQQQQLSGNLTIGTTVSDQTLAPVVSTSIITEGGWFSLYCDSTRVATPSRNPIGILSLALYRNVTDGKNTLIAQYTSVTPPGVDPEIKNPPNGRQWNFTFSGANSGTNNIGTMKILVDVNDAQCSDAGMYYCQIAYFYNDGVTSPISSPGQNVMAAMDPYIVSLTADPDLYDYEVDDNVTFICKAMGPSAAVTFTWVLYFEDQYGRLFQQLFPNNTVPVTNPPTLQPGCQSYSWVSTMSIQVPSHHRFQFYICTVSGRKSGWKTISVMPNRTLTSTPLLQISTTPASQAMALRKRRTPSALELVLLLLASILLVERSYVRAMPVSCLSCLIVGTMCA